MGVSTSPAQLAAKLQASGKAVERAQGEILKGAGMIVKTRVLTLAANEIGGDLSFGGKKRVGARFSVEGASRVMVKATGPMHWLERGVKPHAVVAKGAGGSRAARTSFVSQAFGTGTSSLSFGRGRKLGALRFADGGYRPYARRAGKFSARRTWSAGVEASERPVREHFQRGTAKVMLAPFR